MAFWMAACPALPAFEVFFLCFAFLVFKLPKVESRRDNGHKARYLADERCIDGNDRIEILVILILQLRRDLSHQQ